MWSATLIASQSWYSKPQTKFGVHWPRPRGQKMVQELEGGGVQRGNCDHWVKFNHLQSLASAHPAYTQTPLWVGEVVSRTLQSLIFSSLVPSGCYSMAVGQTDSPYSTLILYYLFSFAYLASSEIHPPAAAHCTARGKIATVGENIWFYANKWCCLEVRCKAKLKKRMDGFNFCLAQEGDEV